MRGDTDTCGHGTHVATLILRIAPEASIYVARVVDDENKVSAPESVASVSNPRPLSTQKRLLTRFKAIRYAAEEWKVDIITMSLGFRGIQESIRKAIDFAVGQETLVFAAASNEGTRRSITFPANCSSVICVNAARGNGAASQFNPPALSDSCNFSVLGEGVNSAWPVALGDGKLERRMSGTSVATPIAAAIAALVLEFVNQKPKLKMIGHEKELQTVDGIKEIFKAMGMSKDGYLNVVPWKLLKQGSSGNERDSVAWAIANILQARFGE